MSQLRGSNEAMSVLVYGAADRSNARTAGTLSGGLRPSHDGTGLGRQTTITATRMLRLGRRSGCVSATHGFTLTSILMAKPGGNDESPLDRDVRGRLEARRDSVQARLAGEISAWPALFWVEA